MTDTIIELSEDEFDAQYPLRTNHLNPSAGWAYGEGAGCLFETYGKELAFVRQQDPRTVWTFIDGDDGAPYVLSGFHLVNRIGYLISTVPVPEGTTIEVRIPMPSEEDTVPKSHTPEPWYVQPSDYPGGLLIKPIPGQVVAQCDQVPEMEANARRIVAAVNACARISTEALEQNAVQTLLEATEAAWRRSANHEKLPVQQRNQLCAAIAKATGGSHLSGNALNADVLIDVHELLADRRQSAAIWSIEDVKQVRPGLTDDQAWEVLQLVERTHDCNYGITWLTLEIAAEGLFGYAPETATEEE
jgi:hypothetical protein